jgi:UDPglucose 6-dehydrogenase
VVRDLLLENSQVSIYDPKVPSEAIRADLAYAGVPDEILEKNLKFCSSAESALDKAHAMVVLTEWEEFKILDFHKIFQSMFKPAFAFDGRDVLPRNEMTEIGFKVYTIGRGI